MRNRCTASATTSSSGSGDVFTWVSPTRILVTDNRFSTIFKSQLASSRIPSNSSRRFSSVICGLSFNAVSASPMMLVSGVLKSCDTARRRFARMVSFSASTNSFSLSFKSWLCFLKRVVVVLVIDETRSMPRNVTG